MSSRPWPLAATVAVALAVTARRGRGRAPWPSAVAVAVAVAVAAVAACSERGASPPPPPPPPSPPAAAAADAAPATRGPSAAALGLSPRASRDFPDLGIALDVPLAATVAVMPLPASERARLTVPRFARAVELRLPGRLVVVLTPLTEPCPPPPRDDAARAALERVTTTGTTGDWITVVAYSTRRASYGLEACSDAHHVHLATSRIMDTERDVLELLATIWRERTPLEADAPRTTILSTLQVAVAVPPSTSILEDTVSLARAGRAQRSEPVSATPSVTLAQRGQALVRLEARETCEAHAADACVTRPDGSAVTCAAVARAAADREAGEAICATLLPLP